MFMGGSETTATSIMWAIAYLIHQPEIQVNRLRMSKPQPIILFHLSKAAFSQSFFYGGSSLIQSYSVIGRDIH